MTNTNRFHRRRFLTATAGLTAAMAGRTAAQSDPSASAFQDITHGPVVGRSPFARLEKIAENAWAVVSTPLTVDGAFNPEAVATLCNGGLIAGEDRVVAIDAFFQPAGAAWLSAKAEELTGKPITDVVVTHFHADHSGGLAGFQNGAVGPEIIATDTTRKLIFERYSTPNVREGSPFGIPATRPVLPTRIITDETKPVTLDLGGRSLTLSPLKGHTPSDLAVIVDDEPITFAGDLVWAGVFHNYVDAIPSHLRTSAGELLKEKKRTIVTGHGYVAKAEALKDYLNLLDHVEEAARASYDAGKTPEEGVKDFSVPATLGNWHLFNPGYYKTAFEAWRRELAGETA